MNDEFLIFFDLLFIGRDVLQSSCITAALFSLPEVLQMFYIFEAILLDVCRFIFYIFLLNSAFSHFAVPSKTPGRLSP